MGNALLIYMMVMQDARQRNVANRAISRGKRHTDCPTDTLRFHRFYLISTTQENHHGPIQRDTAKQISFRRRLVLIIILVGVEWKDLSRDLIVGGQPTAFGGFLHYNFYRICISYLVEIKYTV